ncbi:hypothetical protein N7475_002563 [Penicillium sp. IBT 31633x]|nr:hypothetical protein N7475_002563 [Penicillium sp. IBT 31633x]
MVLTSLSKAPALPLFQSGEPRNGSPGFLSGTSLETRRSSQSGVHNIAFARAFTGDLDEERRGPTILLDRHFVTSGCEGQNEPYCECHGHDNSGNLLGNNMM